jgi:hypothetical protein
VQEVDQEQFGRIEKLVEGVEVDDLPTRPSTQKESAIVADFIRGKSKIIKPEIPDSW